MPSGRFPSRRSNGSDPSSDRGRYPARALANVRKKEGPGQAEGEEGEDARREPIHAQLSRTAVRPHIAGRGYITGLCRVQPFLPVADGFEAAPCQRQFRGEKARHHGHRTADFRPANTQQRYADTTEEGRHRINQRQFHYPLFCLRHRGLSQRGRRRAPPRRDSGPNPLKWHEPVISLLS